VHSESPAYGLISIGDQVAGVNGIPVSHLQSFYLLLMISLEEYQGWP